MGNTSNNFRFQWQFVGSELESTLGEGSTFRIMIPVVWTLEQSEDLMHSPTEEEELEEGIHAQIVSMRLN